MTRQQAQDLRLLKRLTWQSNWQSKSKGSAKERRQVAEALHRQFDWLVETNQTFLLITSTRYIRQWSLVEAVHES